MALSNVYLKQYDTRTALEVELKTPIGNPVDLTDAEVNFIMVRYGNITVIDRTADIIDAEKGVVSFSFSPEETIYVGTMRAEFRVTYQDGAIESFPNSGFIPIIFEASLS